MAQYRQNVKIYEAHGFIINVVRGDSEFKCMKNDVLPAHFDPVAADDHVDFVERVTIH